MSSRRPSSSSRPRGAAERTASSSYFMPQNVTSARSASSSAGYSYSGARKGFASSTSAYRRSPRTGYIASLWHRIKRMLRDLYGYMRAHPFKILLPIVMALISGGALTAVAAKVGLGGVAKQIEKLVGAGNGAKGVYDGFYGSQNVAEGAAGAGGGWMGGSASMVRSGLKMASAFL